VDATTLTPVHDADGTPVGTPDAEEWSGKFGVTMAATTDLDRAVTERLAKHDRRDTTGPIDASAPISPWSSCQHMPAKT